MKSEECHAALEDERRESREESAHEPAISAAMRPLAVGARGCAGVLTILFCSLWYGNLQGGGEWLYLCSGNLRWQASLPAREQSSQAH